VFGLKYVLIWPQIQVFIAVSRAQTAVLGNVGL
jgi:hypothetical protein